jgi:hypothetical protein
MVNNLADMKQDTHLAPFTIVRVRLAVMALLQHNSAALLAVVPVTLVRSTS